MKSIRKNIIYLAGCLLVLSGCNDYDWDVDNNTTLTPLSGINGPEETLMTVNYRDSVSLDNTVLKEGETISFNWEKVKAADYSKVFYEVQYFTSADQSTPFYIKKTGNNKIDHSLQITEREWNSILELSGLPQNAEGEVYWCVYASNGVNHVESERRKIKVKRPDGFARYPDEIRLTGTANEAGETFKYGIPLDKLNSGYLNNKGEMKFSHNGQYGGFIYLADGQFTLQEKVEGTTLIRRFQITEGGELKELVADQTTVNTPVSAGKMHRVWIDFKSQQAKIQEVEEVTLYYYGTNGSLGSFSQPDKRQAIWTLPLYLELSGTSATKYKYKFSMKMKDHSGNEDWVYWGSFEKTAVNQRPESPATYYYLSETDDSGDYCFKFRNTGHDKRNVVFHLDCSTGIANYTHTIVIQ